MILGNSKNIMVFEKPLFEYNIIKQKLGWGGVINIQKISCYLDYHGFKNTVFMNATKTPYDIKHYDIIRKTMIFSRSTNILYFQTGKYHGF